MPEARQRHGNLAQLHEEARNTRPALESMLHSLAKQFGCRYETGPTKSDSRAWTKARDKYKGDAAKICDLCRGMLVVADDDFVTLNRIASHFNPVKNRRVVGFEDKLSNPTSSGFRSLNINYQMPNGHVAEIMVLTSSMRRAYRRTHGLYERASAISRRFNETDLPPDLRSIRDSFLQKAQDHHEKATTPALRGIKLKFES